MSDFHLDLSWSAAIFSGITWPIISPHCGGGSILHVEAEKGDDHAQTLDVYAGIDCWQIIKDQSVMRGIASRVHILKPGWRRYQTFTIRTRRKSGRETEYIKRLRAIDNKDRGFLYPALTVDTYVEGRCNPDFQYAGIVRTEDLIRVAQGCLIGEYEQHYCKGSNDAWWADKSNADFLAIGWGFLRKINVEIKIVESAV